MRKPLQFHYLLSVMSLLRSQISTRKSLLLLIVYGKIIPLVKMENKGEISVLDSVYFTNTPD